MATVYLARDLHHRRLIAIKVLSPELSAVLGTERFLRSRAFVTNSYHGTHSDQVTAVGDEAALDGASPELVSSQESTT